MTLIAFKTDRGTYNVWRYDTPTTVCVLWGCEADSNEDAVKKAVELINKP